MSARRLRLETAAWALLTFLAAVGVFAGTLGHDLVWDDRSLGSLIEERLRQTGPAGLLTTDYRVDPAIPTPYYRPLALLSLWADERLPLAPPVAHHAVALLLHALASLLVLTLLRATLRSETAAGLGALLFAVHPVHVEAVAFVSGRPDLLATVFALVSALCWLRAREAGGPPGVAPLAAGLAAFALGCLSKEVAFLLPAVLLGWDALLPAAPGPARSRWWPRNRAWIAGWAATLAVVLAMRWGLAGVGLGFGAPGAGLRGGGQEIEGARTVLAVWGTYLRLLVFPWPLRSLYSPEQLAGAAAGALSLAAVLALAWLRTPGTKIRTGPWGLLWIAGFLLPVSGAVSLPAATVAERFLYLPSAGFALLAGSLLGRVAAARPRPATLGAALTALGLLGSLSVQRSRVWEDEISLFRDVAASCPGCWWGHFDLSQAYRAAGRGEEALGPLLEAVRLAPPGDPGLRTALDTLLAEREDPAGRIRGYRAALAVLPRDARLWSDLGVEYESAGLGDEAAAALREAVRLDPGLATARFNLGVVLLDAGEREAARLQFEELRRIDPALAERLRGMAAQGR